MRSNFFSKASRILAVFLAAIIFSFSNVASAAESDVVSPASPFIIASPTYSALPNIGSFFFDDERGDFQANKAEATQYIESFGCVTCKIFVRFSNSVFSQLQTVNSNSSQLIAPMVGIASLFAFIYLFSGFVTGDASDLLSRWQVFWRLLLTVAASSIVLANPIPLVWQYVYGNIFALLNGIINLFLPSISGSCAGVPGVTAWPADANVVLSGMNRAICGAHTMTVEGIATGIALMGSSPGTFEGVFTYVIAGFVILAIYGYLSIIFPLRFLDVVIRLAIVSIVTPILVLAATFKSTRSYAGVGISVVLNAAAQFTILIIVLSIGQNVINDFVNDLMIESGPNSNLGSVMVSGIGLVAVAMVFTSLVKAVPSIAAEFSRTSSGGGEGGAGAAAAVAAPAVVGAKAGGAAVGLAGKGAIAYGAGKLAARGLQKSVPTGGTSAP